MLAAILMASVVNPYHPAKHNDAPLDVLLCAIGLVILFLLVTVPAHMARAREERKLHDEQPQTADTA
jgi:hypothetical protein